MDTIASMELRRLWLIQRMEKDRQRLEKARYRLPKLWRFLLRELWSLHRTISFLKARYLLGRKRWISPRSKRARALVELVETRVTEPSHLAVLSWLRSIVEIGEVDIIAEMPDLSCVESFLKLISVLAVTHDKPEVVTAAVEPLTWIPLGLVPRGEDRETLKRLIREYGLDSQPSKRGSELDEEPNGDGLDIEPNGFAEHPATERG